MTKNSGFGFLMVVFVLNACAPATSDVVDGSPNSVSDATAPDASPDANADASSETAVVADASATESGTPCLPNPEGTMGPCPSCQIGFAREVFLTCNALGEITSCMVICRIVPATGATDVRVNIPETGTDAAADTVTDATDVANHPDVVVADTNVATDSGFTADVVTTDTATATCAAASRSCYNGRAGSLNTGRCRSGTQSCANGVWATTCVGEVLPATAETCNNSIDDDCNGLTDDGCMAVCVSWPEQCNGVDDNCDGVIDNGIPARSCYTGTSSTLNVGTCRAGNQSCSNGGWAACTGQVPPTAEVCNNHLDDNCNGQVDEGCGTPNTCTPLSEVCNNVDDNCNGQVDEGITPRSCYTGPNGTVGVGICRPGTNSCAAGVWGTCSGQVVPTTEDCNTASDDNCDGRVNEGCTPNCTTGVSCYGGPVNTQGVGICHAGATVCTNGVSSCGGQVVPVPEICGNNLDDNCDGRVNESGCVGGTNTVVVMNIRFSTPNPWGTVSGYAIHARWDATVPCLNGWTTVAANGNTWARCRFNRTDAPAPVTYFAGTNYTGAHLHSVYEAQTPARNAGDCRVATGAIHWVYEEDANGGVARTVFAETSAAPMTLDGDGVCRINIQ